MANPKKKQSKSRTNKRRKHYKLNLVQLSIDTNINEVHQYHRAFWKNNNLYYKGNLVYTKLSKSKK
ncbi:MAG: 50S ribosomal protein L32 [Candidatus Bostrichicola ureolyticus]|nr:MAG: 50S ribosomal protein L32 [Candidatus Bostrichicola ureolyticus]